MFVLLFAAIPAHETLQACVLSAPFIFYNTEMLSPDCNAQFPVCNTPAGNHRSSMRNDMYGRSFCSSNEIFQVRSRKKIQLFEKQPFE